jgi:hypothetical protein
MRVGLMMRDGMSVQRAVAEDAARHWPLTAPAGR